MIDLHTHSLLSDGELLPTELARRAVVAGYSAIAITDHADASNLGHVIAGLKAACAEINRAMPIRAVAGVELTHIPPERIPFMVKKARRLGAGLVVGHGETLAEPVSEGTNEAFIAAGVEVLAHPGLITASECRSAAAAGVLLEITCRAGHSLSNGHVAAMARRHKAGLVLNTDAHAPKDLATPESALRTVLGAGLGKAQFRTMVKNAQTLLEKIRS